MKPAADKFAIVLQNVPLKVSDVKVITNVTGKPQESVEEIRENLSKQIYSSVQWIDTINFISSQGITNLVEIGPGRILKGLVRKTNPALNVLNCQNPDDIAQMSV